MRVYQFHHQGRGGAKNGTRTRDPDLGKVVLYQLSYFRIKKIPNCLEIFSTVRMKGLEPPRGEAPDPKSGMATNYITSALF